MDILHLINFGICFKLRIKKSKTKIIAMVIHNCQREGKKHLKGYSKK